MAWRVAFACHTVDSMQLGLGRTHNSGISMSDNAQKTHCEEKDLGVAEC